MKTQTILLTAVVAGALLLPGTGHALGPELLPNTSFEESAFEPDPSPQGTLPQPLLPTGWIFEGLAGLFDHSPNVHRTGARAIAISVPASTKRELCGPEIECNDNPINPARDALELYYSVTPHWRTLDPVPVTAGEAYLLDVWASLEIVTEGEGATTAVRWLDANGLPIALERGSELRNELGLDQIDWTNLQHTFTAPDGAASAHVLLGHTDDSWIGQARFDDVSLREID